MKISYAITVCNEREEIERLVSYLLEHKREGDEIVVQQDDTELDGGVYTYLTSQRLKDNIKLITFPLNKDFAQFKNHLTQHCSGDYIFQIDADEIPNEYLIKQLYFILSMNPEVDLISVPRINTVEGITEEHIQKWRWRVDEKGWINFPDLQDRIFRNTPEIKWYGKVHEKIEGFQITSPLPLEEQYCLYHPKQIERQEAAVKLYQTIDKNVREKL